MTSNSPATPEPSPVPPAVVPAVPEITLEEWIAATQARCGVDHPNPEAPPK